MENGSAEAQLKSLGLTEYEVKAYVTLLQHGTLTAERISELGSIPLPRVYDTIAELQKKGFVLISKSRPKVFKPVAAKKALENYLELQRQQTEHRLANLKDSVASAVTALNKMPTTPGSSDVSGTWSIEKRSNILRMLSDEAMDAKKEMLVFSGDLSWIGDVTSAFRSAIKRGVKIKILMHRGNSPTVLANMRTAKKLGCQVRLGFTGMLRGQIIDNRSLHIATKFSDSGAVNLLEEGHPGSTDSRYEMIMFDNPALIDAFKQYFEFWWAKLK